MRTTEIAKQLGVTTATIRRYSQKFEEYLSAGARSGQARRNFTIEDLETFYVIKTLLDAGQTYAQVTDKLSAGIDALIDEHNIDLPDFEVESVAEEPTPGTAMLSTDQVRAIIQPLREASEEWRLLFEAQRSENERLREELAQTREELADERNRTEETRRPWWRFWA